MRIDSNRMLVGGTDLDTEAAPRTPDVFARRHLAEVVIGLLIVGLCLYIFVPVFMGTAESARRTICVTRLRRLAQSLEMYQGDYDSHYPPSSGWMFALRTYVVRPETEAAEEGQPQRRVKAPGDQGGLEVFDCPSEVLKSLPRRQRAPIGTTLSSYTYRQPIGGDNSTLPILWDLNGGTGEAAHPKGGNVAYPDARVAWLSASKWSSGDQP